MKKVLLTLTLVAATMAAFAQGKISFQTDSLHQAYLIGLQGTDAAKNGTGIFNANMPADAVLQASLYMGLNQSAMYLYRTTSFATISGRWSASSVLASASAVTGAPLLNGGERPWIMAVVTDGTAPNLINGLLGRDELALGQFANAKYLGTSVAFQFTLGSSVTYPAMYAAANGPWPAGTFPMAGGVGAIGVSPVPEPSTLALAGLGIASLMILRRRK